MAVDQLLVIALAACKASTYVAASSCVRCDDTLQPYLVVLTPAACCQVGEAESVLRSGTTLLMKIERICIYDDFFCELSHLAITI